MPTTKSLKLLLMESLLFISLFAVLGHLSVNFWERFVIQKELSKMKSSLYTLKVCIVSLLNFSNRNIRIIYFFYNYT